ncbi:MAG: extracellular solute-binding protein [Salinisphaeraceae bacterium]|nr:extracellular solute-binding protein [Salinisphaeraceae bacterium]
MPIYRLLILLFAVFTLAGCGRDDAAKDGVKPELVVYSERNEQLIGPLLDEYSENAGVEIKLVTAKAGALLERLKAEGEQTPADVLLTVDAGNLWLAAENGLLRKLESDTLNSNIPKHLRDPEGRWYGLSVRARTIVHHPERAPAADLSTYAALAKPALKGRLCLRTSKKVYNQSLVAMMISQLGEAQTQQIVEGWVANLAAPPFANDTAVMEAILAGQCDVGIVNSYYFGRLQKDNPDLPLALFWPDQDKLGVHVNISGGAVIKASDSTKQAQALLEWLSAGEAQAQFAASNMEYPANPAVDASPAVAKWGDFKANQINVAEAGRLQADAVKLMDQAGYK